MTDWIVTGIIGIVSVFITVAALLKRTFVFKEDCKNMRRACAEMQEKVEALHEKDLEMRDQTIDRLEEKFEEFKHEVKTELASTRKELRGDICAVKGMVQAILTKMNIASVEVEKER